MLIYKEIDLLVPSVDAFRGLRGYVESTLDSQLITCSMLAM